MVEGVRTTRTEMDRQHSDVLRSIQSNDDDREQRQLEEVRG